MDDQHYRTDTNDHGARAELWHDPTADVWFSVVSDPDSQPHEGCSNQRKTVVERNMCSWLTQRPLSAAEKAEFDARLA